MLVRGAGQNSEIVQLDADTIYELDMKKKRYRRSASGAGGASALSPGALTGQLAGLFGRKKSSEQAPATAASAGLSDMTVPLRLTSELISIGGEHLGADTFEVPAGFKNVTQ